MDPIVAGLITHLLMNGQQAPTPQYPTNPDGSPVKPDSGDDHQTLVGILQGLYGGRQGGLAGGGTIANNQPVVGPKLPPRVPPGGAFGTPTSPGSVSYPPGTIANYGGATIKDFPGMPPTPRPPSRPGVTVGGGLHPAVAAQLVAGMLNNLAR